MNFFKDIFRSIYSRLRPRKAAGRDLTAEACRRIYEELAARLEATIPAPDLMPQTIDRQAHHSAPDSDLPDGRSPHDTIAEMLSASLEPYRLQRDEELRRLSRQISSAKMEIDRILAGPHAGDTR